MTKLLTKKLLTIALLLASVTCASASGRSTPSSAHDDETSGVLGTSAPKHAGPGMGNALQVGGGSLVEGASGILTATAHRVQMQVLLLQVRML